MGSVAFLFAGQGAQVPGMASDVKDEPAVKNLFGIAEGIAPGIVDKMLCGTQEELNRTLLTQPTMFGCEVVVEVSGSKNPLEIAVSLLQDAVNLNY